MLERDGKLYIVATPIGNLSDISYRAVEVLREVDLIAAEDTRHSRKLLHHFGVATPMVALHEHNELAAASDLIRRLSGGETIALISDAGTPLVSDPGFPLVRMAGQAGISVVPVPGPCAMIAALSVSGLPTDRFRFVGFPPRSGSARRAWLAELKGVRETVIFYESSHRVLECLKDVAEIFPASRPLVVARELTKMHETVVRTSVTEVVALMEADANMQKGEFVILIQGAVHEPEGDAPRAEELRVLEILLKACSVKTAAAMAAEITGGRKKRLYEAALALAGKT